MSPQTAMNCKCLQTRKLPTPTQYQWVGRELSLFTVINYSLSDIYCIINTVIRFDNISDLFKGEFYSFSDFYLHLLTNIKYLSNYSLHFDFNSWQNVEKTTQFHSNHIQFRKQQRLINYTFTTKLLSRLGYPPRRRRDLATSHIILQASLIT